jgi:hypothetical protein
MHTFVEIGILTSLAPFAGSLIPQNGIRAKIFALRRQKFSVIRPERSVTPTFLPARQLVP